MQCDYFDADLCRSCTHMGQPYRQQLDQKVAEVQNLLADHLVRRWLDPVPSPESGFRNKAKMAVGGTVQAPTLGILDRSLQGVDLQGCGLYPPALSDALPHLARFITEHALTPYDARTRRGELKHLILTLSPDGELMVRFVLRSKKLIVPLRRALPALQRSLPNLRVVSVNLLREPKALVEGDEEILLSAEGSLPMRLNGLELRLHPQGFFQTNSTIAAAMYSQAADWAEQLRPHRVWDLFCGVGGFALACAIRLHRVGSAAEVTGLEISEPAIKAAREAAQVSGVPGMRFISGDAQRMEQSILDAQNAPELLVLNPPRRGLGAELCRWVERSAIPWVIYSSCHARSLSQDLHRMPSWEPAAARVFDMFPQTDHSETMVLLRRRPTAAAEAAQQQEDSV